MIGLNEITKSLMQMDIASATLKTRCTISV